MTIHSELRQFTGTTKYIQHSLCKHVVFTEGVDYLCNHANCFWLINAIASHIPPVAKCVEKYGMDFAQFHAWTLTKIGEGALLEAKADTYATVRIKQKFEFTDFPFDESGQFKLFVAPQEAQNGTVVYVIHLPSEY